jgi:hypothetical protein
MRRAAAIGAICLGVGAGTASGRGHVKPHRGHVKPHFVVRHPLPEVVRQGETVVIRGHLRGDLAPEAGCLDFCVVRIRLQLKRTYGAAAHRRWHTVTGTICCYEFGGFVLRWLVPRRLATGPIEWRLSLFFPPNVAMTRAVQSFVGPAPVYCARPTPPSNVPAGDGWITGGDYIEGGPFPGIDECQSDYTVTATNSAGQAVASEHVTGRRSFTLVVPAGSYALKASSCGSGSAAVTAGKQTKADVVCPVP